MRKTRSTPWFGAPRFWTWWTLGLFACDGGPRSEVIEGPVVIHEVAELARLDGVQRVTGKLTLEGSELKGKLELPELEQVGLLSVTDTQLSGLALGSLKQADDIRIEDNASLSELALPALEEVTASLVVGSQPKLKSLSLPKLLWARTVDVCGALASLSADELRRASVLYCESRDSALEELVLPKLEHVDSLFLHELAGTRLSLPALTTVTGKAFIGGEHLEVVDLPKLRFLSELASFPPIAVEAWDFPALEVAGKIDFHTYGTLRVRFDRLRQVSDLWLSAGEDVAEASHVSAPRLERAGRISLWEPFQTVSFPRLQDVGSLRAPLTGRLEVDQLEEAGQLTLLLSDSVDIYAGALRAAGSIQLYGGDLPCDAAPLFPALKDVDRVLETHSEGCP